jgi:hypothetical protein
MSGGGIAVLQIWWESGWVTVTPTSTPPAIILSGDSTGAFWRIGGLSPDTQYHLRFQFTCADGGPCDSGITTFTTDEPGSSSSSSSSSACPCSGPEPNVVKWGPGELGVRVPTSGMTNTFGLPDLEILINGTWIKVTSLSVPPAPIIIDGREGDYWSVSGLQPITAYQLRHIYHCIGGGSCESKLATGKTTHTSDICAETTCDAANGGCPK